MIVLLTYEQFNLIIKLIMFHQKNKDDYDLWYVVHNGTIGELVSQWKDKLIVLFTKSEVSLLLAMIDCADDEMEPDFIYDEESDLIVNTSTRSCCSLQHHLNEYLTTEKLTELKGGK